MRKLTTATVVIVMLASLMAACGSDDSSSGSGTAGSDTYRVVFIGDLSGSLGASGKAYLAGLQASAKDVNSRKGIQGKSVEVHALDDQGDPVKAVSQLRKALEGDRPDMVWCGTATAECLAMMPTLTEEKILTGTIVQGADLNDGAKWPYFFSASPQQTGVYDTMATHAKGAGAKHVGFFHGDDLYGETSSKDFEAAAKRAGLQVTSVAYGAADLDVSSALQRLVASGIDYLVVDAYGVSASYIVQARTKLGVDLPTLGTFSFASSDLTSFEGTKDLDGVDLAVLSVQVYKPSADQTPGFASMFNLLKADGQIVQPMNIYSIPYDTLQALKLATDKAKSVAPTTVIDTLLKLKADADQSLMATYNVYSLDDASRLVPTSRKDFAVIPFGPVKNGQYGAP